MATNLSAPVALACELAQQEGLHDGAVVNLLDQKVANLNPDFFSYTCTKIALEGATTMLAQALAPRVRVNAVSPGLTLPSGDQSDTEFAAVAGQNLLQRPVPIEEISRAVEYLLTAPAITGQNLFVDNGQRFLQRDGDVMFSTPGRRDA
jgi:NAD(P)-dependent dehydrogenase (short-subunit alcohol dehydrogenase family)